MAFSKQIVTDLLRRQLGLPRLCHSDTGIINDRAWASKKDGAGARCDSHQRRDRTLSGFHDVKTITDLVQAGLGTERA